MKNEDKVFKIFKNPAESGKKHRIAIQKFLKDDKHAVLAIDSIQGSGKTTAIIDEFAKSSDAILLTQSNVKISELVNIINRRHPDLDYHAIYGLEAMCDTYLMDEDVHGLVGEYRKIGILTEDIHHMICLDDECAFSKQEIGMEGRIIESVNRFFYQITLGDQFWSLHAGRIIMIDEADGLFSRKKTDLVAIPYNNERLPFDSVYLPEIYQLNAPEGTYTELMEKYKELITDIFKNKEEIKDTIKMIELVTQKYYSTEVAEFFNLPITFFIFKTILERRLKLIIGTATLRNHRINFNVLNSYFQIALFQTLENSQFKILKNGTTDDMKLIKLHEIYEYLDNLKPDILEFEADYIPGFRDIFVLQSHTHSFSHSHYKRAFNSKEEEIKKGAFKELRAEIVTAIRFYELQTGKKAEKILLITFKTVMEEIERYKKKLRKNRNLSHDPIFLKIKNILPLFSNRMHGINANQEGYDLILTIGDPLDPATSKFATDTRIIEVKKTGFRLKETADPTLKSMLTRTMLAELLEAFHRGRGEIPIIALSNFLAPDNEEDITTIKEILKRDNFTLINVFAKLWKIKHKGTKEMDVFIQSLNEEIGLEFK